MPAPGEVAVLAGRRGEARDQLGAQFTGFDDRVDDQLAGQPDQVDVALVLVAAFLDERLAFTGIPSIVEDVLAAHKAATELTLEAVLDAEQWARAEACGRIEACS